MHQRQPFLLNLFYHDAENGGLLFLFLRQENEASAVLPLFRHGDALQEDKLVWDLHHDAGTVARLVIRTFRPSVTHVFQHFECRFYYLVGLFPAYVYNHTHTAGVLLVGRVV
ncbi:hypothetical protein Barb7_00823 [Bacteroidales bacterium Barb7]|nr:hypothetical protein Barb7_00823 [Bacteroidales bacterium Barb7]